MTMGSPLISRTGTLIDCASRGEPAAPQHDVSDQWRWPVPPIEHSLATARG